MSLIISIILLISGLIIIIVGGNWMVANAVKISYITGIPQALIGATIVSLATTLPELNVTIFSAIGGLTDLAVGNAIGSIIFNMTFIIGIVLLFTKNKISKTSLGVNFYIMFFVLSLIYICGIFDIINKFVGMLLITLFLLFFIHNIIEANKKGIEIENCRVLGEGKKSSLWVVIVCFCLSSFLVSVGAKMLVQNGEKLARLLFISEHIIGVTIIAIGTSLPEVVTAISSIKQKSTSIAIGNTIGANILSSTLLVGMSAILEKTKLQLNTNIVNVALPLILFSSLILFIPIKCNVQRYKVQGVILLLIFVVYYITVIL